MSLTHRSGGPLLAAHHHSGDRGRGRVGADFSGTGLSGPSLPFLSLGPGDMGKEIWPRIDSVPPGLTYLFIDELGNVDAEGSVGVHEGQFSLFLDGEPADPPSAAYIIIIGDAGVTGAITGQDGVAAGSIGAASTTGVAGALMGDDGAAAGVIGSNPASTVSGGAVGDDGQAQGTIGSQVPTVVSGTLTGEDGAAGGTIGVHPPSILSGDISGDDGEVGGRIFGGGASLPPVAEWPNVPRLVRSRRLVPTWVAPFDTGELADIYFDFSPSLIGGDLVASVEVTCEARVGIDANAQAMCVGEPVFDTWRAVQRLQPGVAGVIYLVRATATLASGQRVIAATFIRVRRQGG